jgi:hypothetical protein
MKQIINELSKEVTELKDRGEIGLFAELKLQNIINKLKEAINYTRCCKSDSELLLAFGKELLPRKQHIMLDKHIRLFLEERSK